MSTEVLGPPSGGLKRKACLQCTKAKRKCDKQVPVCRRCVGKGLPCKYPLKRVSVVYDQVTSPEGTSDDFLESENSLIPRRSNLGPATAGILPPGLLQNAWFLSPDTWILDHTTTIDEPVPYGEDTLHNYIGELKSWLRRWVSHGSSPLIHAQLYRTGLPSAMEDAYTSVTAFLAKNDTNNLMTMRILENRVQQLINTQPDAIDGTLSLVMINTISHLARTQALFIYQLIRLFDGDIRSRAQAESHNDLLRRWARQMWESATMDIGMAQLCSTLPATEGMDCGNVNAFQTDGSPESLWRAWIVGESIRRTYLLSVCMLSVYNTLKQGWSPCPGGLTITSRKGLWDATSPYKWLETSRFCGITTIESLHCGQLFEEARPSDIDDFTTAVLLVSHGKERLERWAAETEA